MLPLQSTVSAKHAVDSHANKLHTRDCTHHDTTNVHAVTQEEGLTTLEVTRNMSALTVTLSKTSLDTKHPGYQPPLPADQVCVCACCFYSFSLFVPVGKLKAQKVCVIEGACTAAPHGTEQLAQAVGFWGSSLGVAAPVVALCLSW